MQCQACWKEIERGQDKNRERWKRWGGVERWGSGEMEEGGGQWGGGSGVLLAVSVTEFSLLSLSLSLFFFFFFGSCGCILSYNFFTQSTKEIRFDPTNNQTTNTKLSLLCWVAWTWSANPEQTEVRFDPTIYQSTNTKLSLLFCDEWTLLIPSNSGLASVQNRRQSHAQRGGKLVYQGMTVNTLTMIKRM